ncbi:hypothetical protein VE02_06917 [Pseudogymnoascus sp. 03VT05]|nr:hypothetical protein VE02_06917 [Pseudogymnoascus sp. 03VT05]
MCYCLALKQPDTVELAEIIGELLDHVNDVLSKNDKLKDEIDYTVERKPSTAREKISPRKDLVTATENSATNVTATENTATEDTATENTATENTATENTATENTATENTATENTATENTATENTATENTATEDTATEDTATENTAAGTADKSTTAISKIFAHDPAKFATKLISSEEYDGVATADKHKTSGICVSTEIGSSTNETSGLQMILEAAGRIEKELNVASQNEIRIGSTSSEHFADCFTGGNISHRLPEVDDDNRGHEPFHTPEPNIKNLLSGHPSPSGSSSNGAATSGLLTSLGSRFSDPTISNHPSDEPNRMQYVATDQIARNLYNPGIASDGSSSNDYVANRKAL